MKILKWLGIRRFNSFSDIKRMSPYIPPPPEPVRESLNREKKMKKIKELQQFQEEISGWSDDTFGSYRNALPMAHHMKKEIDELIDALESWYHSQGEYSRGRVLEEYADIFILLLDSAGHFNLSVKDLIRAATQKLAIAKLRDWGQPDEKGVVEHIREGGRNN